MVGTAFVIPEEQEPKKGRILVFEITRNGSSSSSSDGGGGGGGGGDNDGDRRLNLVAERDTQGAVFSGALPIYTFLYLLHHICITGNYNLNRYNL